MAGRVVLLWPDNDEAGQMCMQKLAAILTGMGCRLRLSILLYLGVSGYKARMQPIQFSGRYSDEL